MNFQLLPKDSKNSARTQSQASLSHQQPPQQNPESQPLNRLPSQPQSQLQQSQLTSLYYKPIMSQVQGLEPGQSIRRLKQVGIYYHTEWVRYTVSCIRTDWESSVYEIRYGNLRTELKIISVTFDPALIHTQYIAKGSYGVVSKFISKGQVYALKAINILNDPNLLSLQLAIRQVLFSKIFSALQIGPKFHQLFQYDAIICGNSLIFAMEYCNIIYEQKQLQRQIKYRDLLRGLKTIHYLNICHRDIKYANIGWSCTFGKFVFLDFNFSEIIRQSIGYKTNTKFIGTYHSCSPEMKKLYLLKKSHPIDLYHNDLYCLQKTWLQMSSVSKSVFDNPQTPTIMQLAASKLRLPYTVIYEENQEEGLWERNQVLLRYFGVKFWVFGGLWDRVRDGMGVETVLVDTFGKIVINLRGNKNVSKQIVEQLRSIYIKNSQQKNAIAHKKNHQQQYTPPTSIATTTNNIDFILSYYEQQNDTKLQLTNIFSKMIQVSESQTLLAQIWHQEHWKQNIFLFIDVYSSSVQNFRQCRLKIMNKLHQQIAPNHDHNLNLSDTLKFRQILLHYYTHFKARKNKNMLERILAYFVVMDDRYHSEVVEAGVMELWETEAQAEVEVGTGAEAEGNLGHFYRASLGLYLGNLITEERVTPFCVNKFVDNFEKIMKILEERQAKTGQEKGIFYQAVKSTIDQIQAIIKVRSNCPTLVDFQQADGKIGKFIEEYGYFLNKDIIVLLKQAIIERKSYHYQGKGSNPPSEPVFQSLLLQKYYFKMKLSDLISNSKLPQAHHLLCSQAFTRQFSTIFHLSTLPKCQELQKRQICQDYLQIANNGSFICTASYIEALVSGRDVAEVEGVMMAFLREFRVGGIGDAEGLRGFSLSLSEILGVLTNLRRYNGFRMLKENARQLYDIVMPFLQFSKQLQKQYPSPIHLGNKSMSAGRCPFNGGPFENLHRIIELYILQLSQQLQTSIDTLISIIQQKGTKIMHESFFISFLCVIYQQVSQKERLRISGTIFDLSQIVCKESKMEIFFVVPKLLEAIIDVYVQEGLYQEVVEMFVVPFCGAIQAKSYRVRETFLIAAMVTFVEVQCPAKEIKTILLKFIKWPLIQFEKCYWITYFLALGYSKLCVSGLQMSQSNRRRVLTICAFSADRFGEGQYQQYKKGLRAELKRMENRSKRYAEMRRSLQFVKISKLIEKLEEKLIKSKWNHHRQKIEVFLSKLRGKIIKMEKNNV